MIASQVSTSTVASRMLERASDILGRDLSVELCDANPQFLITNHSIQLAVFLATQMHLARLSEEGIRADYSLGLSLGEYSHLVDIGALGFADALRLVDVRGALYDAGPEGMMVSLFPVTEEAVRMALEEARTLGRVEISNFNSPRQFVISGDRDAVQWAAEQIEDREFASAIIIEDRIPMHSTVFTSVAGGLRPHLERANWKRPDKPYVPNVTAKVLAHPGRETFIDSLCEHVYKPVLWRQSIEAVHELSRETILVEVGPGRVLSNLMKKPWISLRTFATDDEGPAAVAHAIAGSLHIEDVR